MYCNFAFRNRFQEENDFFLCYLNGKLKDLDSKLIALKMEEEKIYKENFNEHSLLNKKVTLLNSKKVLDQMKEHYYNALNQGIYNNNPNFIKKHKKNNLDNNNFEDFSKKERKNVYKNRIIENENQTLISSILILIQVARSIKFLKNHDEFLNFLYSSNIKFEDLDEITNFYKTCFSKSSNQSFHTNEAKLQFSSNMLEIYCNEFHPLHSHFRGIRQKVEYIGKSSIFLSTSLEKHRNTSENFNKNDVYNVSGSQSDDTRRVLKKNLHINKENIESYDGDSEKSYHKNEREEFKEENEEEFVNKAKSDGESQKNFQNYAFEQYIKKTKFKPIINPSKSKFNKIKRNKKSKKMMFYDSGDHATGSASEKYQESRNKLFSWGIRGFQKINNKPPKGFDTDKDMKI